MPHRMAICSYFIFCALLLNVQDLTYSVRNNQNRKETLYLLKGVTGYFQPRRMTALVGWAVWSRLL